MIQTLYMIYLGVAIGGTLVVAGMVWLATLAHRRRTGEEQWMRRASGLLTVALLDGAEQPFRLPLDRMVAPRRRLAELIATVLGSTYGLDPAPAQRLMARWHLDQWLLRRVRRSRGLRRAHYLKLMADLPLSPETAARVVRYADDPSRAVRFMTLLVRLAASPAQALRLLAAFADPFTPIEVAEILALLRRGLLPIAYRPLLLSPHDNLRRIGLALVGQFGIEEAEPHLLDLLADREARLAERSLYVLALLHRPLRRRAVTGFVRCMDLAERRRLLRFLAHEEYSLDQVRALFRSAELPYYERIVGSYKRSLVCG